MDVHLTPYGEQLLQQQISAGKFRSPDEVVERALEVLTAMSERGASGDTARLAASLDALAEGSEGLPVLPAEATTRSAIYRDPL